ncbi:MAG: glycosyltransferase family 2 protein [Chloroflexi bacterium]|nr:glycosyltransferase family 2 protein [Chloroflexota bacterium]
MITLILPAYNEEAALPAQLQDIVRQHDNLPNLRVIVVDDGSADRTAEIVQSVSRVHPWIHVIQHEQNKGLSQAIQTGFRAALDYSNADDAIIIMDADNTQPVDLIPRMVAEVEGGADVVIASRFQPGAEVHGVPFMRRRYSEGMSLLFRTAFPIENVRDYSCGFRAYRAGVLQRAYDHYGAEFITEQGFACMVEVLFQLDALGDDVTFAEVPMVLRYDQKPTPTKMRVVKTIRDTLRVALRFRNQKPPQ